MQENNFEGQVHNMMEGFTLGPSEKVWEKIQADIHGQKKSRFGMLPAAMLICCLLFSTFILHDLEKRQSIQPPLVSSNIHVVEQAAATIPGDLNKKQTGTALPESNTLPSLHKKDFDKVDKTTAERAVIKDQHKQLAEQKIKRDVSNRVDVNIKDAVVQQDKETGEIKMQVEGSSADNKRDTTLQNVRSQKQVTKTDSIAVAEKKGTENPDKKATTSKQKNKRGWDYFIAASTGKFSTGNSYLGQIANSAYYYGDYLSSSTGGAPGNMMFRPAPVKPGLSFTIAIKASRKISDKTSFSFGLGYQYAGTSVATGQLLGASANARDSFATGNVNSFHNQYHFIQLPLEIHSMIGKGNKLPLYWNAGLLFSRLISANVLQFDNTRSRYYNDNRLFNKNSVSISAGLSLAILKNQKIQWLIGPQFYYSLTPVAGKGLYDKTHYSFLGLQLQKKL